MRNSGRGDEIYDKGESFIHREAGVWGGVFGKVLRWILFLPITFIAVFLVESFLTLLCVWLFGADLRTFILISVFVGISAILGPVCLLLFWGTSFLISFICPNKNVGAVIFATLYIQSGILWAGSVLLGGAGVGEIVINMALKLIFSIVVIYSIVSVYSENNP